MALSSTSGLPQPSYCRRATDGVSVKELNKVWGLGFMALWVYSEYSGYLLE